MRLLRLFAFLVILAPLCAAPAAWVEELATLAQSDEARPPAPGAIAFVGSITIKHWTDLAAAFPRHQVLNRGLEDISLNEIVDNYDALVTRCAPSTIVLVAGAIDIQEGRTPDEILRDFQAFASRTGKISSHPRLLFVEITTSPSRWKSRENVVEANQRLQDFCLTLPNAQFVPFRSKLLDEKGKPRRELFSADGHYLSPGGYRLLAETLQPFLPSPPLPPQPALPPRRGATR